MDITIRDEESIKLREYFLIELRQQFLDAISEYSEENWAAGWVTGIEETVRNQGGLWLVIAAACQGWPKGYRAEDGWEPLSDEEKAEVMMLLEPYDG